MLIKEDLIEIIKHLMVITKSLMLKLRIHICTVDTIVNKYFLSLVKAYLCIEHYKLCLIGLIDQNKETVLIIYELDSEKI